MTTSIKAQPRRLDVADVLVLLMPSYWTRAGLSLFAATRYCAIVALLSCCHLGLFIQRNIDAVAQDHRTPPTGDVPPDATSSAG